MWIAGRVCLEDRVFLSSWPCLAALSSAPCRALGTCAGGRGRAGTPGGCRAEMCSGEDTWGGSAQSGLPSLSGTHMVAPETKAAVTSGRAVTGSHADALRKAPWGVGGSWVQGGWSPSETRGGGQLGAGAETRQRVTLRWEGAAPCGLLPSRSPCFSGNDENLINCVKTISNCFQFYFC